MYKWLFLAKECKELRLVKEEKLARKINKLLIKLYGVEIDIDKRPAKTFGELIEITTSHDYCIACDICDSHCKQCLLAKKDKWCGNENSLYRQFYDGLYLNCEIIMLGMIKRNLKINKSELANIEWDIREAKRRLLKQELIAKALREAIKEVNKNG